MLGFFERLIDPYPPQHPVEPPKGIYQFCRHYVRGVEIHLVVLAILTTLLAISEAMLYSVLGQIVDWLAEKNTVDFFAREWLTLSVMSVFVLFVIPLLVLLHSAVIHQTLMGNFPMRIRWLSHRYLLGQSYTFFNTNLAGVSRLR